MSPAVSVTAPPPPTAERPPGRARRQRLRVAAVVLAVVVMAELVARGFATRLPEVTDWVVRPIEEHIANLDRLGTEGETIDTVVLGSSSAGAAVDPRALAEGSETAGTTYNAWLAGARLPGIDVWAQDYLFPRVQPDLVVIGLTSRELGATPGPDQHELALRSSRGYERAVGDPSALAPVEDWLLDQSTFLRYRHTFREPADLLRDLWQGSSELEDPTDAYGMLTNRLDVPTARVSERLRDQERQALQGYQVTDASRERLRDLIRDARAGGAEVAVVNLPVLEDVYLPLHPDGAQDYAEYERALETVVAEEGVTYVDARTEEWGPDMFGDQNHLNGRGAARLTALLAERLDAPPATPTQR